MKKLLYLFLLITIYVQAQFSPTIGVIAGQDSGGSSGHPYTIEFATDDSNEFSVVSQVTYGYSLEVNPEGTKFWVADATAISEYSYTAGDVSSASYNSPDFDISIGSTRGLIVSDSGTKAYTSNTVERQDRFAFSTAYDLSTLGASNQNQIMTDQVANIEDIEISPDGTKYYLMAEETIWQYTLSTPWDLTTETYASKNLVLTGEISSGTGTSFDISPDGTTLIAMGTSGVVYQYTMSTAWDVSTGSYDSVSLDASGKDSAMWGCKWTLNGTKLLLLGIGNDKVYQYSVN